MKGVTIFSVTFYGEGDKRFHMVSEHTRENDGRCFGKAAMSNQRRRGVWHGRGKSGMTPPDFNAWFNRIMHNDYTR